MVIYFNGLEIETSMKVYEPELDSYLLAENIKVEKGARVLDVGTGTGLQALVAASQGAVVTGVDVNAEAVNLARENAVRNTLEIEFLVSDLFENVSEKFDLVVINPPYLPVEEYDILGRAWSGGPEGVDVIDRFLAGVPDYLKDNGRFLLVLSSHGNLEEIWKMFDENNLDHEIIASKKLFMEELLLAQGKLKT